MMDFRSFLIEAQEEAQQGKPLKHLTHTEDHILNSGDDGVMVADSHLNDVHNLLLGRKVKTLASMKYDGSPSVIFGRDPESGKFFVASKSAFNKKPKLNYTPEDVVKNHGHAPGLVAKLQAALQYLPEIMPKTSHHDDVYQGDIMHTGKDAVTKKGMVSITPNTITYSAPTNSREGKSMKKPFGIVIHTHYRARRGGNQSLGSMVASPISDKRRMEFRDHPEVNNINPKIEVNPANYSPEEQRSYLEAMENARRTYATMEPQSLSIVQPHAELLGAHINDQIRNEGSPSIQGYIDYLTARHQKDLEKTRTQEARDRRIRAYNDMVKYVSDNRKHFQKALEMHSHVQNAKNVLVGVMAKNNPYATSVDGVPVGPEGTVVYDKNGNASKLNNRTEFNRLNFLRAEKVKREQAELRKQQGVM